MARFTTLYSGSSGNAGVVEHEGRFLMVDMGGSCKATVNGLLGIGLTPQTLSGILVTHEHSDHIKGLRVFLKKYQVPIYGSAATLQELWHMGSVPENVEMIAVDGREEDIDGFKALGFATSHDSAGCCGFRVTLPDGKIMSIATDLGKVTQDVYEHLQGAHMVALEANYDEEMLQHGPYPYYLKKRISSPRGHLSNVESAETVASLVAEGCSKIALCHMSKENNHSSLVLDAVDSALFTAGVRRTEDCIIQVNRRYEASPWIEF